MFYLFIQFLIPKGFLVSTGVSKDNEITLRKSKTLKPKMWNPKLRKCKYAKLAISYQTKKLI